MKVALQLQDSITNPPQILQSCEITDPFFSLYAKIKSFKGMLTFFVDVFMILYIIINKNLPQEDSRETKEEIWTLKKN